MEPPTLDEDCLRIIVGHTHSANTLFAMAKASPGLRKLVLEHLATMEIWHPGLHTYEAYERIGSAFRSVGAELGYNILQFRGKELEFYWDTGPETWRDEFLAKLPSLKRVYIQCACMGVKPEDVKVRRRVRVGLLCFECCSRTS